MQKKKTGESEELYGELGKAFNFTQGDLEANRAGFLSFRQKHIEVREFRHWFLFLIVLGIGALCPALCTLHLFSQIEWSMGIQGGAILMTMFGLTLLGGAIHNLIQWRFDMSKGRVKKLSGCLNYVGKNQQKSITTYIYKLDNEVLRLNGKQFLITSTKKTYRIYLFPRTNQILSIEEALPEQE